MCVYIVLSILSILYLLLDYCIYCFSCSICLTCGFILFSSKYSYGYAVSMLYCWVQDRGKLVFSIVIMSGPLFFLHLENCVQILLLNENLN